MRTPFTLCLLGEIDLILGNLHTNTRGQFPKLIQGFYGGEKPLMRTGQELIAVHVSPFYSALLSRGEHQEVKTNLLNQECFNVGGFLPESLLMSVEVSCDGFALEQVLSYGHLKQGMF